MLKKSENPPMLNPQNASITDFQGTWWVAHTKSRNEKALAWQMYKKQIHYFLPMNWKVTVKKGRKFRSLLPLFTGYLFFCGRESDRMEVLQTNRVANLLEVKNSQKLIADLLPIEQLLKNGIELQPHPYIKKGRKCRVTAGPLQGTEGIVSRDQVQTRLVLQVDMLGQSTSVEIEADLIEIID